MPIQESAGPGGRFDLGQPEPAGLGGPEVAPAEPLPAIPPAPSLYVTPRDPRSLHVHWSLDLETAALHRSFAEGSRFVLVARRQSLEGAEAARAEVAPDSSSSFLAVPEGGAVYAVELGYFQPGALWRRLAAADPVRTPPERSQGQGTFKEATILPELPPATVLESAVAPAPPVPVVPEAAAAMPGLPPSAALEESEFPASDAAGEGWAPAREDEAAPLPAERLGGPGLPGESRVALGAAVEPLLSGPFAPSPAPGGVPGVVGGPSSVEVMMAPGAARDSGLGLRADRGGPAPLPSGVPPAGFAFGVSSAEAARQGPTSSEPAPVLEAPGETTPAESPAGAPAPPGAAPPPGGFWLEVEAEVVVYGRTESGARVRIAGRTVPLRPDGSFSLRFALPDGCFDLPVAAASPAGDRGRQVRLEISRQTGEMTDAPPGPSPRAS